MSDENKNSYASNQVKTTIAEILLPDSITDHYKQGIGQSQIYKDLEEGPSEDDPSLEQITDDRINQTIDALPPALVNTAGKLYDKAGGFYDKAGELYSAFSNVMGGDPDLQAALQNKTQIQSDFRSGAIQRNVDPAIMEQMEILHENGQLQGYYQRLFDKVESNPQSYDLQSKEPSTFEKVTSDNVGLIYNDAPGGPS